MTDSFLHEHQSALDSQIEEKAIRELQDAGIYPDPDNTQDDAYDQAYDRAYEELSRKYPDYSEETLDRMATGLVQGEFIDDYEPTDLEMQQSFGVAWHDAI